MAAKQAQSTRKTDTDWPAVPQFSIGDERVVLPASVREFNPALEDWNRAYTDLLNRRLADLEKRIDDLESKE